MKQKLKYLLIIGTTLSVTNGGMGEAFENTNPIGETKTPLQTVEQGRKALSTVNTNNYMPVDRTRVIAELTKTIDGLNKQIENLCKLSVDIYFASGKKLTARQKIVDSAANKIGKNEMPILIC